MQYKKIAALAAVANVFAHPFRALFAPAKPAMTITAPIIDTPVMPRAIVGSAIRAEVSGDPKEMMRQFQAAFEEFKRTNDAAVGAKADSAETKEQLERINGTLNTLEAALNASALAAAAAQMNAGGKPAPSDPDYSGAFASYMRSDDPEASRKLAAAQKAGVRAAMSEGVPADGGLLTPIEWDRTITGRLKLITPMRQEATVISISKAGFTKLFTDRQVGSGWVGETASRPATATPQFTALPFGLGQLYANAAASQDVLDDAEIDLEAWLTGEIETEFSRQEGIAFTAGDGVNKPYGFLNYAEGGTAATRHPWGAIEVVTSGNANLFTTDKMIDTVYKLPAIYTPNAKFYTNRSSLGAIRKLKDGQNNYIWNPTFVAGQPSTVLGYPVVDMPDMPNAIANALAMAFGDMREAYLVIDRIGVRILRDPYTNKPYICFYVTKRVGGGVKNPDAMKIIKIAA